MSYPAPGYRPASGFHRPAPAPGPGGRPGQAPWRRPPQRPPWTPTPVTPPLPVPAPRNFLRWPFAAAGFVLLVGDLMRPRTDTAVQFPGFTHCMSCTHFASIYNIGPFYYRSSNVSSCAPGCLTNQAIPTASFDLSQGPILNNTRNVYESWHREVTPGQYRHQVTEIWTRPGPSDNSWTPPSSIGPWIEPPYVPTPFPPPGAVGDPWTGGQPNPVDPREDPFPEPEPRPDPEVPRVPGPAPDPLPDRPTVPGPDRPRPRVPPRRRPVPRRRPRPLPDPDPDHPFDPGGPGDDPEEDWPLPWPPGPNPGPGPEFPPSPRPDPRPDPRPRPRPDPRPEPRPEPDPPLEPEVIVFPDPRPWEDLVFDVTPGYRPSGRIRPRPNPRRVRRNERERKIWVGYAAARILGPLLNTLTETYDFINALYDAVPRCLRPRGFVGPARQAETVYRHFEYIDWRRAIGNLVAMQAEDYVIGRTSQIAQEFSRMSGLQYGFDTGLRRILEPLGLDGSTVPTDQLGSLIRGAVDRLMADYVPPVAPC